jgi:hypothetical protein
MMGRGDAKRVVDKRAGMNVRLHSQNKGLLPRLLLAHSLERAKDCLWTLQSVDIGMVSLALC